MKKIFVGKVVSISTPNTIIVEVLRHTPHPMYRKLLRRTKRFKVHTQAAQAHIGDMVKIVETRPYAKDKFFMFYTEEKQKKSLESAAVPSKVSRSEISLREKEPMQKNKSVRKSKEGKKK